MKKLKNKKFIITIFLLLGMQALIFFSIKYLESDYHYITTSLDLKIPFIKWHIYIYNMFYPLVLVLMAHLYIKDEDTYYKAIVASIIGYLMSDVVFLTYPTIMYGNRDIVVHNLTDWVVKITYLADNPPLNCLPSIHCLFCFQTAWSLLISKQISKKMKVFSTISMLVIIMTTLTVKQHYVYDVLLALLFVIITNIVVWKTPLYKYIKKKFNL